MKGKDKLAALAGLGIFAFALGRWTIPASWGFDFVRTYGYWVVLVTFLAFTAFTVSILVDVLKQKQLAARRGIWTAIIVAAVGTLYLHAHDEWSFKVIEDELVLAAMAREMHFEREVAVPDRGHEIVGVYKTFDDRVDKRHYFYPFLVSLAHDVTGFRVENGFAVNAFLTPVLLLLTFATGFRLGRHIGGITAALLLVSTPALTQSVTGGGFELLNLVMIFGCLLLAARFVDEPGVKSLSALCLGGVLLAQTRYESAVFVAAIGLVVAHVWWRRREVLASPALYFSPLLLVPYLFVLKAYEASPQLWQLDAAAGLARPFGLEHLGPNLARAGKHFLDNSVNQPNSLFLVIAGVACLPVFFGKLARAFREPQIGNGLMVAQAAFLPAFLVILAVLMLYGHADLLNPTVHRLTLPLYVPLLLIAVTAVCHERDGRMVQGVFLTLALLGFFLYSAPVTARHTYSERYEPGRVVAWMDEFVNENSKRDYLMIATYHTLWLAHGEETISIERANGRAAEVDFLMRSKPEKEILVIEKWERNPATGEERPIDPILLSDAFVLETIEERAFGLLDFYRLSRVVRVRAPQYERIQFPADAADPNGAFLFWVSRLP